jgi:UPF0755 protein
MAKRKKAKKKSFFISLIIAGFLFIICISSVLTVNSILNGKIKTKSELLITIPKNADIDQVISIFNSNNIFQPQWIFKPVLKLYAKFEDKHIVAGCYRIPTDVTQMEIIKSIYTGYQLFTVNVTYPEGITLRDFASISARKLGIDSAEFMDYVSSDSFLKTYNIPGKSAEGYLMPLTYEFNWKQSVEDIAGKLITQQNKIWNEKYERLAQLQGRTRHEILTLASLIEGESPVDDERPSIAGVYINRLKLKMKLECDPTVQYAVASKRKISLKDLHYNSPYNTYLYPGLPPGPINSPSLSSIEAALAPEYNNYLYFVARGDGSGRHNFSTNFRKHQQNISQYHKNRKRSN